MSRILVVDDDRTTRVLLRRVLEAQGFSVTTAKDGIEVLRRLRAKDFNLVLLDIWMPRMSGLEVLACLRSESRRPKIIVMTSDNTPETLLRAVREQAYHYLTKPIEPKELVGLIQRTLAASEPPPIEILSARPDWVELLVPCDMETAQRIQQFMAQLEADLSEEVRQSVGIAFRELLANAMEWGGRFDPNRRVRIAYLRARRMLLYRIADPGEGFRPEQLAHAAVGYGPEQPLEHMRVREQKGLRPGGFGILLTKQMVDELLYNEAHNEVVFVKYLS